MSGFRDACFCRASSAARRARASLTRARVVFVASLLALSLIGHLGCTSVSTVRLQPEAVAVDPGMRPIAGIQANAVSAYVLFIPIPGGVELDRVVNRMLVVAAKRMGADKITNLQFDITPSDGIWALRKLLGYRAAQASGIAVQLTAPAPDPDADLGPEAPESSAPGEPARSRDQAPGSQ